MRAAALIMAGGSGERFAGASGTPKQMVELCGRPMISWSTDALAQASQLGRIVIVLPQGLEAEVRAVLSPDATAKLHAFVVGGATRQESVFNGLSALPSDVTHVLIHDAARPCVSSVLIESILDALQSHHAVVPAVAVADTLVRDAGGKVDAIIDRVHVAGVQTPQAFQFDLILRAHREARARGFQSSDDGSLVLALGETVHTLPGERTNIKVTVRADVAMAEAILTMRKNGVRT
ncbi:MAG TPA: 2-C-methyl-D-erythritol 4-phosphate cytidylyltransferase [Candidatus Krumholzibacteria bacterium]|nr:2-C-methyl-D-erythritol 4-phosphate cytidylyltransferase [Candidatus Krumholzibacteria bacterium]